MGLKSTLEWTKPRGPSLESFVKVLGTGKGHVCRDSTSAPAETRELPQGPLCAPAILHRSTHPAVWHENFMVLLAWSSQKGCGPVSSMLHHHSIHACTKPGVSEHKQVL